MLKLFCDYCHKEINMFEKDTAVHVEDRKDGLQDFHENCHFNQKVLDKWWLERSEEGGE